MKVTDKYVFFWREWLSQWNMTPFTVNDIVYNCAEQYMMAKKADLFNDEATRMLIMDAPHPREQQALGRTVKNFDPVKWDGLKESIVYTGNYFKFSQNPGLKAKLLKYETQTFVEASPYDKVWGIGMDEKNEDIENEELWQGQNLLGKVITKVRDKLLMEK